MLIGILIAVRKILYPPTNGLIHENFLFALRPENIDFATLSILLFFLPFVTAGFMYTLRDKKVDSDKKGKRMNANQTIAVWLGIVWLVIFRSDLGTFLFLEVEEFLDALMPFVVFTTGAVYILRDKEAKDEQKQ